MEDVARITAGEAIARPAPATHASGRSAATLLVRVDWRRVALPALAFLFVAGYFVVRSLTGVVPEGDSTLHLHLMETVANGHLPKSVPYFAAIVGEGGEIEARFPYSYPLLYHLLGGAVFKIGGERLAMMVGPVCAGLSAAGIVYLLRGQAWPLTALAVALAFSQWITQPVMTWVYMEPMMLAFFVAGLCFYQRAWARGSTRAAVIAGIFFGLAIATRQNALVYLVFIGVHALGTLLHSAWSDVNEVVPALRRYGAMLTTSVLVALPFLAYLAWTTGTVGYADVAIPGFQPTLAADPQAVEYLRSFSVPHDSPLDWMDQYWLWTLFTRHWQIGWFSYIPLPLFVVGVGYLRRQGKAGLFLATYAPVHVLGEMLQLMTVHGNWRYIVGSRVLFAVVVAAGIYYLVSWAYRAVSARVVWNPVAAGALAAALVIGAILPGFVTLGLVDYLAHQEAGRAGKGDSYRELGVYIDQHVPQDALILSGRWYTTGYYARRDYTWVTYYGNTWVIDAISDTNPVNVRGILDRYGIDYIIFQAPPPQYLDAMPSGGLRTIVLEDLDHFQLLFRNERTRLYRFWPDGVKP